MGSRKSLVLGTLVILHVLCGNKKFEFVKQYFYIDFASNEIKVTAINQIYGNVPSKTSLGEMSLGAKRPAFELNDNRLGIA